MTDFSDSADAPVTPDASHYEGASDDFLADLGDAFMGSVESVDLGEDGSLDMRIRQAESESEQAPQGADPASSAADDQPQGGQPNADTSFLESQYKEVQGWATRVSQENAELKAQLQELIARVDQGSPSAAEEAGPESNMDPETREMFDSYLEHNLGNVLSQKLGIPTDELGELLREAQINRELRAAYAKYDDFDAHLPAMTELSQKYPSLSFDQLYDLVTTLPSPASEGGEVASSVDAPQTPVPQGTTESPAPQPQQPQPSQEELAQRAKQVSTLQSQTNEAHFTPERTIKTPRDAMIAALEDGG